MPEFYMTFAPKNIFPIFFWGGEGGGRGRQMRPASVSYAYGPDVNGRKMSAG